MQTSRRSRPSAQVIRVFLIVAVFLFVSAAGAPPKEEALLRFNNLGIAYLAQYKAAEAEKLFQQAAALDPNYVPAHVNLGIAALAQVHYPEAIAAFSKALALDPSNIYAHFNLSLIYKLQGKTTEALASALEALQRDPRDPDIHYHVGSLHMTVREYDKAIEEFESVLKLDPNFLSAYYGMGRAYLAKGDVEKGKKFVEEHRRLQAGASATPAVGLRYGEQGRYSYAMDDTGGSGPTPPLIAGAVTFTDASQASGITFMHGGVVRAEALRKAVAATDPFLATSEALRKSIGPMLGSGVAVADVNGDGKEDLFFANASGGAPAPPTPPPTPMPDSALYLNRGALKFEAAVGAGAPAVTGSSMSAAFGDLDGDADPDLTVALVDRLQVFLNDGAGNFKDVSADSGVAAMVSKGLLGGVSLADVDHDGDLDIFVAGFLAPPAGGGATALQFPTSWPGAESFLFINSGGAAPGGSAVPRFTEAAANAKISHAGRRTTGAVFSDFDNDRDIDLAMASPGDGTTIFSNQRDGTFTDMGAASGLPANALVLGLTAGDYDKDGRIDLAATTWDGGVPRLFRNMTGEAPGTSKGAGAFALDVSAMADVSRQIGTPEFGVAFADFDNDGFLDLLAVNGGDVGPALFVLRNQGDGSFMDAGELTGADKIPARHGRGLAVADLDADGDLDFVISNSGGRPAVIRNDGGSKNHWVRIAPAGLNSNKPAVGTKVEIKAGRLWQKMEVTAGSGYLSQSSLLPHFGLGARDRVDTVRLLWPGGVLQDEVKVKADSVAAVQELDRKGSSCPILYAFNGEAMAFVSDFLGGSAIGYRTGPRSFNFPDTDEYVKIRGDQLKPGQGRYELRLVNQLEETIYFDRARLLAVDHPADYEIFPDERLMPSPPYPPLRVHVVKDARPPAAAWDDEGRDLLSAVSRVDREYAGPAHLLPFKGYAREHRLMIDPGPRADDGPLVLLLHGWIDYADSTSNLAASQAGAALVPPYLEALVEAPAEGGDVAAQSSRSGTVYRGVWVSVLPQMGFPAGLPKTMTVDLTGKLPAGSRLLRIVTSMRIYWDQVRVATEIGPPPAMTAVEATTADLRYRGFPALTTPDGRPPEAYDYGTDQSSVHWMSHTGAYTRYGDVRELLREVDDRYVITRAGDEIALEFPAGEMPPLAPGMTRDFLLFADGFGKDMDINSARPDTVTPLPYHAMPSYPHPGKAAYPFDRPGLMDYLDAYNTRLVTSPLMPIKAP